MLTAESPVKVAEALCHELSHTRMSLVLELGPVLADDAQARHRSPWRRDPRPLIGLVNGVHAFLNVSRFYQKLASVDARHKKEADRVSTVQREKINAAWHEVREHAALDRPGRGRSS